MRWTNGCWMLPGVILFNAINQLAMYKKKWIYAWAGHKLSRFIKRDNSLTSRKNNIPMHFSMGTFIYDVIYFLTFILFWVDLTMFHHSCKPFRLFLITWRNILLAPDLNLIFTTFVLLQKLIYYFEYQIRIKMLFQSWSDLQRDPSIVSIFN